MKYLNSSIPSPNTQAFNGTAPLDMRLNSILSNYPVARQPTTDISLPPVSVPLQKDPGLNFYPSHKKLKEYNSRHIKTFKFIKSPKSVFDIWNEYTKGFSGQPSIKEMEAIYKTDWRRDPAVNKRYARRKVLWKAIENGLAKGFTLDYTIELLEDHRCSDRFKGVKEPIGWLCQRSSIPEALR